MTEAPPLIFVSHPRYREHNTGGGIHPEGAERLDCINQALEQCRDSGDARYLQAMGAERKWVLRVHDENYLLRLEEAALSGKSWLAHPDNRLSYETYEVALLAAGAGLTAIDFLEKEKKGRVFCAVRPPGHHAEPSLPLGFCFLNNVAVAARYWQEKYHRKRIAIFDFDGHHGNGIQAIFEEDSNIFYASIHEHPTFSFPGTGYAEERGSGAGLGATLNVPLLPGSGDLVFRKELQRTIEPALRVFQPEALVIAAGFDGHQLDDMSGLSYSNELFGCIGKALGDFADRFCEGRMISVLEGGYNLGVLGKCVELYLRGLTMACGKE
jgi:acetoin utilization deacetylase AcuC-like enzyme